MSDQAAVNNVGIKMVESLDPHTLGAGCFSHTTDRLGEQFNTPILSAFLSNRIKLFGHSLKTQLLCKQQTEKSMTTCSITCWWSKLEVMNQLLVKFGDT